MKVVLFALGSIQGLDHEYEVVLSDGRQTKIRGILKELSSGKYYEVTIIDEVPANGSLMHNVLNASAWCQEINKPKIIPVDLTRSVLQ